MRKNSLIQAVFAGCLFLCGCVDTGDGFVPSPQPHPQPNIPIENTSLDEAMYRSLNERETLRSALLGRLAEDVANGVEKYDGDATAIIGRIESISAEASRTTWDKWVVPKLRDSLDSPTASKEDVVRAIRLLAKGSEKASK